MNGVHYALSLACQPDFKDFEHKYNSYWTLILHISKFLKTYILTYTNNFPIMLTCSSNYSKAFYINVCVLFSSNWPSTL
jgi:hypothetical protein